MRGFSARPRSAAPVAGGSWRIWLFLAAVAVAEALAASTQPQLGLWTHAGMLVMLLGASYISDRTEGEPLRDVLVALALIPLLRIVSSTYATDLVSPVGHLAVVGSTFVLATLAAARALRYEVGRDLRLHSGRIALQVAVTPLGALLGVAGYALIAPPALSSSLPDVVAPIAVLVLVSCGQELYFRGLLLTAMARLIAPTPAVLFVALAYGAMHLQGGSWPLVAMMTVAGLALGWFSLVSRSILGGTAAHALANVTMFVLLPRLVTPGG